MQQILEEISRQVQNGNCEMVEKTVCDSLKNGIPARDVYQEGLVKGMSVVLDRYKSNDELVPDILLSTRALYLGISIVKEMERDCLSCEPLK